MTMLLTDEQITELERQLVEAETEWATTQKDGRAQQLIAFKAVEYLRRVLNDLTQAREALRSIVAKDNSVFVSALNESEAARGFDTGVIAAFRETAKIARSAIPTPISTCG